MAMGLGNEICYQCASFNTVYFLITVPKKFLRRGLALKLERNNYTSMSAAPYMTV